jgi:hypothetical protein
MHQKMSYKKWLVKWIKMVKELFNLINILIYKQSTYDFINLDNTL